MGYLNWRPEKNWKFSLMRRPVLSVQILKCARAQEKYVFSGGLWCTAVSYTHLDVYKRQDMNSEMILTCLSAFSQA